LPHLIPLASVYTYLMLLPFYHLAAITLTWSDRVTK